MLTISLGRFADAEPGGKDGFPLNLEREFQNKDFRIRGLSWHIIW